MTFNWSGIENKAWGIQTVGAMAGAAKRRAGICEHRYVLNYNPETSTLVALVLNLLVVVASGLGRVKLHGTTDRTERSRGGGCYFLGSWASHFGLLQVNVAAPGPSA